MSCADIKWDVRMVIDGNWERIWEEVVVIL
jgi:hypothetical protein